MVARLYEVMGLLALFSDNPAVVSALRWFRARLRTRQAFGTSIPTWETLVADSSRSANALSGRLQAIDHA